MQNYERIYAYVQDFQRLIYDIYSKHAVAFLATYYNISEPDTVWDDTQIFGGAYERVGDLTGMRWNKYLLLPVYFIDEVSNLFDGQDIGLVKENITSVVIPSTYGITPYSGDLLMFEQSYVKHTNNIHPVYEVTGIEITVNADRRFWKMKVEVSDETIPEVDHQVSSTYTFFEYDKNIHTIADATFLTRLLYKKVILKGYMKSLWDENSGLYYL